MAKLAVTKLSSDRVVYNGQTYVKANHPVLTGDIVECFENDEWLTEGGFYEVLEVDSANDFHIKDNEEDIRERDHNDKEFTPYRKITGAPVFMTSSPLTPSEIVINTPVRLVLTNIVSIEINGGERIATTV